MFKSDKMDNEHDVKKEVKKPTKKKVRTPKTYSGLVINPVKIGTKYDLRGKKGKIVTGFTKKEHENYIKNKIIK